MASWTPEHSKVLSQLLDQVVGSTEMIDIRQDFCRLHDWAKSIFHGSTVYITGSAAEGLELPDSDRDFMYDINDRERIQVVQSLDEIPDISSFCVFRMCTENATAGFALLQPINFHTMDQIPHAAFQSVNGVRYLSSDFLVQNYLLNEQANKSDGEKFERQGPSVEYWNEYDDKSEPGVDNVPSIHCPFWPNEAAEWVQRLRYFDWPTSFTISSIIEFGFHLVPVGHPLSDMKLTEWRL